MSKSWYDPTPPVYIATGNGRQSLDQLEAHAQNTLQHIPGSTEANDKLALIREIRRLRGALRSISDGCLSPRFVADTTLMNDPHPDIIEAAKPTKDTLDG